MKKRIGRGLKRDKSTLLKVQHHLVPNPSLLDNDSHFMEL